jgi:hypothetical protein
MNVIGYLISKEGLIFSVLETRVLRIRPNRKMEKIMLK